MEERLKRRKLDALKRGVHRVADKETLATTTHVVGIGKAGAGAIAEILRNLEPDRPKVHALAIDIGDQDLTALRAVASVIPPERAEVVIVALPVPARSDLFNALQRYPEFLNLEYPIHHLNENHTPWLDPDVELPNAGSHVRRAVAKAIYGQAYYSGSRRLDRTLRNFAENVDAAKSQALVAIIFGLGGGTGSGIVVDLARHLSNRIFGRRVLVAGIGIAPCDGDVTNHRDGSLFPIINELDCLGDETKNRGIVMSSGDLFRNPFTAGFVMIPQQQVWRVTRDLERTHQRCNQEIAAVLTIRGGTNFWELLRLLNWVAAPSTQHSAARTPWGPKWIHMLGFADAAGQPIEIDATLPGDLGLLQTYKPEYIEIRVADPDTTKSAELVNEVEQSLAPEVPPQVVSGGREGSVQFILPCIRKSDLDLFHKSRLAYDQKESAERLLDHSLLLDKGIMLCEKSTRLDGMAGASLPGSDGWIAVGFTEMRGENVSPVSSDITSEFQGAV